MTETVLYSEDGLTREGLLLCSDVKVKGRRRRGSIAARHRCCVEPADTADADVSSKDPSSKSSLV